MTRYRKTPAGTVAAYAPPSDGPFKCADCEYVNGQADCRRPEVVAEFKALNKIPRTATLAPVEFNGCCNHYEKHH